MEAITTADHRRIARITEELAEPDARGLLYRTGLAAELLKLFRADFLGTTHYNRNLRLYENPKCYNRDDSMSREYFEYFQFVDPVSAFQRRRRTPTLTFTAMPCEAFRQSEYYNDFLRRHQVEEGIDLYLYDGQELLGDFRVWRARGRPSLGPREALLLSALKPWLAMALRSHASTIGAPPIAASLGKLASAPERRGQKLSIREAEVLRHVADGRSDKEIARALGISFWTVRTHLTHLLQKTSQRNRVGLATWSWEHIAGRAQELAPRTKSPKLGN